MNNHVKNKASGLSLLRLRYPFFVFAFLVGLQLALFYLFYPNPWLESTFFSPLVVFYARISGWVLAVLGYHPTVSADIITGPGAMVAVKKGCDALEPMAIFASGIIAVRAGVLPKIKGLLAGLGILFVLNIIRIVSLYLIQLYSPGLFEMMHLAVWQAVFILVAIMLWLSWLHLVVNRRNRQA